MDIGKQAKGGQTQKKKKILFIFQEFQGNKSNAIVAIKRVLFPSNRYTGTL